MFRTIIATAALFAAAAGGAQAQSARGYASDSLTVYGQPRDAYVIRLPTLGKDVPTLRNEIFDAAHVVCRLAPRTGNVLEMRPTTLSICINQARFDAFRQLDRLVDARRGVGVITVAANAY